MNTYAEDMKAKLPPQLYIKPPINDWKWFKMAKYHKQTKKQLRESEGKNE